MICDSLGECCSNEIYACENKSNCIEYRDCRSNASCEERNKRYNLVNDRRHVIALFHVDGGMICSEPNTCKCDFLYIIYDPETPTAIFVELKGKDIRHAVRQIEETIDRYGAALQRRVCARIVCNAVPRLYNDPSVQRVRKKLGTQYKGTLKIFEKGKNENYSEL